MARVTVEDCVLIVENRFELLALASKRAKDIYSGAPIMVDRDNDKNAVVSLREIATRKVDADSLKEQLIQKYQTKISKDAVESDDDIGNNNVTYEDEEITEETESFSAEPDYFGDESGFIDDNFDDIDS